VADAATASPDEVTARLARFARSAHARDLWPEVSAAAFRAAQGQLGAVTAAVLRGDARPVGLERPPTMDARTLGVAAFAAGIGPLIAYWCETGVVTTDEDTARVLATQLDHGRRRASKLKRELERVLRSFADRGIRALVFKGMHTAYRYFPDPGTRTVSDIDILVPPGTWEDARATLRELGFSESADERHPEQSPWTLPEARTIPTLEFAHADGPWSIDLHRSLGRTAFQGLSATLESPEPAAWDAWRDLTEPAFALPQPTLLAYLALHTSSHFYSISQLQLTEIVLVARRDFAAHPERWEALDRLIAATRNARFVFPALHLAERFVPGTIDGRVLAHTAAQAPARLRRLVRRTSPFTAQRLHPFPGLRERFVWIGSPRDALAAFAWLAWPHDGARLAPPHRAVGAQWRRIRRATQRILGAWLGPKPG